MAYISSLESKVNICIEQTYNTSDLLLLITRLAPLYIVDVETNTFIRQPGWTGRLGALAYAPAFEAWSSSAVCSKQPPENT
jgi:hypothetical protein